MQKTMPPRSLSPPPRQVRWEPTRAQLLGDCKDRSLEPQLQVCLCLHFEESSAAKQHQYSAKSSLAVCFLLLVPELVPRRQLALQQVLPQPRILPQKYPQS